MWKPNEEYLKLETAYCPVCRTIFGRRSPNTVFMAHCEECRATFTWKPGGGPPTVVLDKDVKKSRRYCGKNGCYCHS